MAVYSQGNFNPFLKNTLKIHHSSTCTCNGGNSSTGYWYPSIFNATSSTNNNIISPHIIDTNVFEIVQL